MSNVFIFMKYGSYYKMYSLMIFFFLEFMEDRRIFFLGYIYYKLNFIFIFLLQIIKIDDQYKYILVDIIGFFFCVLEMDFICVLSYFNVIVFEVFAF